MADRDSRTCPTFGNTKHKSEFISPGRRKAFLPCNSCVSASLEIATDNKRCSKCREWKPFEEFARRHDGIKSHADNCYECERKRSKLRRETRTPEQERKHKECLKRLRKTRGRIYAVKHKYKIGEHQYAAMIAKQENKCAICGNHETKTANGKINDLSVDHCHSTGAIRGLLCHNCNAMIGLAKDIPETLRKAANYLESFAAEPSTDKRQEPSS